MWNLIARGRIVRGDHLGHGRRWRGFDEAAQAGQDYRQRNVLRARSQRVKPRSHRDDESPTEAERVIRAQPDTDRQSNRKAGERPDSIGQRAQVCQVQHQPRQQWAERSTQTIPEGILDGDARRRGIGRVQRVCAHGVESSCVNRPVIRRASAELNRFLTTQQKTQARANEPG